MASPLPAAFLERLERIVPAQQLHACLHALTHSPATSFRTNTLKTSTTELTAELAALDFKLAPLPWPLDTFTLPETQRRALTQTDACRQGRLYIQNPSSMVPPLLLAPQPTEEILDLTAAPGSKTSQLAALMHNQGRIAAVERSRSRFFRLKANLKNLGATNVHCYLKDGAQVWHATPERFDRVLLDAPCSGEGRFTDDPATYKDWKKAKIRRLIVQQSRLFFSAVQCLKPGGVLVYSTCTFAPEENEGIVHRALERFGEALEVDGEMPGTVSAQTSQAQPGLTAWNGTTFHPSLHHATRLLPNGLFEGFFLCKLRKRHSTLSIAAEA